MRLLGTLIPNGANRKLPAPRSSRVPNTLGESNRGTQSQSIDPSGATSAPVWQSDRKEYSAIGVNGDGPAAPDCAVAAPRAAEARVVVERDRALLAVATWPPSGLLLELRLVL